MTKIPSIMLIKNASAFHGVLVILSFYDEGLFSVLTLNTYAGRVVCLVQCKKHSVPVLSGNSYRPCPPSSNS